ncbi:hypothetical protein D3C71_376880 [compost metagenome]
MFIAHKAHAIRRAKLLKQTLARYEISITQSAAQETLARMYEHQSWAAIWKSAEPISVFDQDATSEEVARRHAIQLDVLRPIVRSDNMAAAVLDIVRPTAREIEEGGVDLLAPRNLLVAKLFEIAVACERRDWEKATFHTASLLSMNYDIVADYLIRLLKIYADDAPRPMHHIALIKASGPESVRDIGGAKQLLRQQLDQFPDDPDRAWVLVQLAELEGGRYGGQPDRKKSLEIMKTAAALDLPLASFSVACMCQEQGDYADAADYYRKAADADYPEAMTNLAILIAREHASGDFQEVMKLMTRAAFLGDEMAADFLREIPGSAFNERALSIAAGNEYEDTEDAVDPDEVLSASAAPRRHWRDVIDNPPAGGWLSASMAHYASGIVDGTGEEAHRYKRTIAETAFECAGHKYRLLVAKSANQAHEDAGTLNEINAVAMDGDKVVGALNASVVRSRGRMSDLDFFEVCDSVSHLDATMASLILERTKPHVLFETGKAMLGIHDFAVERGVVPKGAGMAMLSALGIVLTKAYGKFGTVALLVEPMQFSKGDIGILCDPAGQEAAAANLRKYFERVRPGSLFGSGTKTLLLSPPKGGIGAFDSDFAYMKQLFPGLKL